jgi:hypothetical protein
MRRLAAFLGARRRALVVVSIFVLGLTALGTLYWRSEFVSPQAHYDYVLSLLSLREADAQTDAELLANRLQLTRNYDALTADVARAQRLAETIVEVPLFFAEEDKDALSAVAQTLIATLAEKAQRIEVFKRSNAVLRNSMAFFPKAGDELRNAHLDAGIVGSAEHYMREVLGYLQAPDAARLTMVDQAAKSLAAHSQNPLVATLLRHGKVMLESH